MLPSAQIELQRRLIDYILQEKIEFATKSSVKNSDMKILLSESTSNIAQNDHLEIAEEIDLGNNVGKITGIIKGKTEKASLIAINNGSET
ncbi:MAG: hypothetical protein ACFFG0_33780 [Candidatus Thorarchaeota archaeon]